MDAGLDVITDGEQTRLDFNLSFYGFIEGIELESASPRRFGPPAHDQRGKHKVDRRIARAARARRGRGIRAAASDSRPPGPTLKASVPGPLHAQRAAACRTHSIADRYALTEALLPIVRAELEALVAAGCREITRR